MISYWLSYRPEVGCIGPRPYYLVCTALVVVNIFIMSGVVLGGVVEVVGSNLARGKIFTASIGSVDSLYPSVYIYIYIYIDIYRYI